MKWREPTHFVTKACHVGIAVSMIATFIAVFFYTYVANVESAIVTEQISTCVDDMMFQTPLYLVSNNHRRQLASLFNYEVDDSVRKQDEKVEKSNKRLRKKSVLVFLAINVFALCCAMTIAFKDTECIPYVLLTNGAMTFVAGMTYFGFISQVSRKTRFVDANYVCYSASKSLEKCMLQN